MLLKSEHLTNEIEKLSDSLRLNAEDFNKRKKWCDRIYKSLKSFYPDCELLIYGSTLNGYGTKESDLDLLFIPFPGYHAESFSKANIEEDTDNNKKEANYIKKEIPKSPTIYEIVTGKISKDELLLMDRKTQLSFVRRVLQRNKSFKTVLYIFARCPIIQFKIPGLKISCDVSCGSSHVVQNTRLLRFYSEIDVRVQPLVIALRLWGKSLGFIQTGLLSSYAFTLLVIFFLQNVDPPILPPVKYLQDLSETVQMEDGWNVAFNIDPHKVKKSQNNKSVGELFREFFCFCKEFDFCNNVVCPNSGKSLPIKEFLKTTDCRIKEFEISPMCIQDPFLLSCNTSRNLKGHPFYFFRQAAFLAVKIIDETELDKNFSLLFDRKEYDKLLEEVLNPPMSSKSISFAINFNSTYLLSASALEKRRFYKMVCDALLELFQFGLLIDCEVVNMEAISTHKDEHKHFQFLRCIQCAAYNRTYIGRRKLKELPNICSDEAKQFNAIIQYEYTISNYLIQQNPLLACPEPFFWFYCDIYLGFLGQFENLIVSLTPLTESKEAKTIFSFLQPFLEKNLWKMFSDSQNISSNEEIDISSLSQSLELYCAK